MAASVIIKEQPSLRTLAYALRRARGSNQAREAARAFIGKPLKNQETNLSAVVSGRSFKKMLSWSAVIKSTSQQAHHQAVANVDMLFTLATLGKSRDPERESDIGRIARIHHFDMPMPFDAQVLWVKLLVKEMADKRLANPLYTVAAIEVNEQPPGLGELESGGPNHERVRLPTGRPEGFGRKFSAMVAEVKIGMCEVLVDSSLASGEDWRKTGVAQ